MTSIKNPLRVLGPAFITAAVVIGPGSVTMMTVAGAQYGYELLWLPVFVAVLMAGFCLLFVRFGLRSEETFFDVVARRWGRPFAVLCGLSAFYIVAAFQFGNNLGVGTAMAGLVPAAPEWVWPLCFNALSITFLFAFKSIYRRLERIMLVMVVAILVAFAVNLCVAGIDAGGAAKGLLPRLPKDVNWVVVGGLVATTFSILAAINQVYLVRAKGWTRENEAEGRVDTLAGIAMLALISMIIMATSAAVLKRGVVLKNAGDMSKQLSALFGSSAQIIFCLGLAAAAFSSFVMNAMIGGVLFSDSMGKGWRLDDRMPKALGVVALLVGMVATLLVLASEDANASRVACLTMAQAGTLLAVPLAAICTWLVLFDARASGEEPLGMGARAFVLVGILVLLAVSARTAMTLYARLLG